MNDLRIPMVGKGDFTITRQDDVLWYLPDGEPSPAQGFVPPDDMHEFEQFMMRVWHARHAGQSVTDLRHARHGNIHVSTVFLAIDHGFSLFRDKGGPAVLWETMVFPHTDHVWRYMSAAAALRGHMTVVGALVRRGWVASEVKTWPRDTSCPICSQENAT